MIDKTWLNFIRLDMFGSA